MRMNRMSTQRQRWLAIQALPFRRRLGLRTAYRRHTRAVWYAFVLHHRFGSLMLLAYHTAFGYIQHNTSTAVVVVVVQEKLIEPLLVLLDPAYRHEH